MAKIAQKVLESMARMRFAEKDFCDWLDEKLAGYQTSIMFQTDEVQLRILQGRAQELAEIRNTMKEASDLARKA